MDKKFLAMKEEGLKNAAEGGDAIWYDGPKAYEGKTCPECDRGKLTFRQYQTMAGKPYEVYYCDRCFDFIVIPMDE